MPEDQVDHLVEAKEECPTDSIKVTDQPFGNG